MYEDILYGVCIGDDCIHATYTDGPQNFTRTPSDSFNVDDLLGKTSIFNCFSNKSISE